MAEHTPANFAAHRARDLAHQVERLYPHCSGTFADFQAAWDDALSVQISLKLIEEKAAFQIDRQDGNARRSLNEIAEIATKAISKMGGVRAAIAKARGDNMGGRHA